MGERLEDFQDLGLGLDFGDTNDDDAAWALEHCVDFLRNSRLPFIFCTEGFVGIGPKGSQAGDVLCAILGCRALLLLRPMESSKYLVVGPCYVHNLNRGEALLGPFPPHYDVVLHLQSSNGVYVPHYRNIETGERTMWDPRIDWADQREPHPPM